MAVLDAAQGRVLIQIARSAIEDALGRSVPGVRDDEHWLRQPGASFVTLERHRELRGCVGTLEARRSLGEDVSENARLAAFRDRRFAPLTLPELEGLEIKVSVLGRPEPLAVGSEADLLALLRPGIDGLVLEHGSRRATFLPQVWEHLTEPRAFLERLREKAGLPSGFWADDLRFRRYGVQSWSESEP